MDYHNPQSSLRTYNHNVGAAGRDDIGKLVILCEFLDSLGTDLNVLDDTVVTTPELPFSIPTLRHDQVIGSHQDVPWNASRVNGSPNPVDRLCQSQWDLSWWLVRKINTYRLALQRCDDLRPWARAYERTKDIINDGLHALGDISQKRVPNQFNNILCAMIVQQAIYVFAQKRNLFRDVNESAFSTWRGMIPEATEANQKILDAVFERLTSWEGSSSGDTPPSWPSDPSFSGVGSIFPTHPLSYPMTVDNNSVHDPPQHGPLSPSASFNPPAGDYSIPPYMSQAPTFDNYVYNFGVLGHAPNSNNSFFFDEPNQYATMQRQPPSSSLRDVYRSSQQSTYPSFETRMNPGVLHHSNPFRVFMEFMNGFKDCGNLLPLFSYDSYPGSNGRPHSNGRSSEVLFYMNAKSSFFGPLRNSMSQFPHDPVARAIVSITLSLVSRGELHSFTDTADYMIHLSKHLLPSLESCASFARVVLDTCSSASASYDLPRIFARQPRRDQNQNIGQRVEAIVRDWTGAYHPTYLLQQQGLNPRGNRNLRRKSVPRASSKQPTLFTSDSSRSNGQSYLHTGTDRSTALTTNTSPSVSSTVQCPSCDKSFTGKHASSHLSRHKRNHREGEINIPCPGDTSCEKVFHHTRTDNIRTHCRNVHHLELPKDKKFWAEIFAPFKS